jgi:hypothetical protein
LLSTVGFVGHLVDDVRPVQVGTYPNMVVVEHNYFWPDDIRVDSNGDGNYDEPLGKYVNKNFPGETRQTIKDIRSGIY